MDNNTPVRRQTDEFLTIPDLWRLCVARWNWFLFSLILCLGVACYYLTVTPDLYTSEAAVLVKQETTGKTAGHNVAGNDLNDIGLVQTNANVTNIYRQLTSLEILCKVVRRMHMADTRQDEIKVAQRIQKALKAKINDEKSTIINLKYDDLSPQRADSVLALVVQVFNEKWVDDKNKIALSTSRFIGDRLSLLEDDLGDIDDSISNFKMRHGITDMESVSQIYLQQQSQSDAEILKLTNQISMARYILGILRDKSTQHQLLPTNSGINNQMAEAQITQYNNMILQLKGNLYGTSAQNPLIMKQEAELDDVRNNILSTIENHVKTLDIQLRSLQNASGEAGSKISSSPGQAKHLVSVEREQKVKESLYLYLLQKKEENEISMTYNSYITEMIDMPHGSGLPTSPNDRMVLMLAILFGLLIPTIIIFACVSFDTTIRDRYDIEHHTTISLIGEVPLWHFNQGKSSLLMRLFGIRKRHSRSPIVVQPNKQDVINEAFRLIRANVEFMSTKRGENNVYIVTSSFEKSGKTLVSMNLALALALKENRVLFIDGDLRHASASRYFGGGKTGITAYLAEKSDDWHALVVHRTDYPLLDILPVGTIPPNPTELLSSERLGGLIREARHLYDFIIIDCPPTETLADTGIIERQADRTLFVMRAGLFERKHVEDIDADAKSGKYKHMSIILNAVKPGGRYGYRYGYKYGYYYGFRHGYHTKD